MRSSCNSATRSHYSSFCCCINCSVSLEEVSGAKHGTHKLHLQDTIFHPQGGGQPSDTGIILYCRSYAPHCTTRSHQCAALCRPRSVPVRAGGVHRPVRSGQPRGGIRPLRILLRQVMHRIYFPTDARMTHCRQLLYNFSWDVEKGRSVT